MKKFLLVTSAIVAAVVAAPAGAADLRAPIKAPPIVRPACAQFGGFYIGAHAGWGYYDYKWNDRDAWTSELSDDLQRSNVNADKGGFIGGVQGGYNWQSNCTVFGIEADFAWSSINASARETDSDLGINTDTLTIDSRLKGIGTVRARTGVVVDNLLIYVTGGFAYAKFNRDFSQIDLNTPGTETFSHSRWRWGWTAGFGTEWAITQNWSLKSEVLYARFEKDEQSFICVAAITCGPPGEPKRFESQDSVWTTKIGLNYRFGGGYPVAARY